MMKADSDPTKFDHAAHLPENKFFADIKKRAQR